eukprot:CAMPEP_0119307546 /NCGR_PEP_ID=MMETSP1333-20130426/8014_1 /TAXON_ID=418940 /ORGANISM="Scyphosphaera apsteinii, Strain RCC1455" /LENGTH=235 /DNA_ID=CAMNT_0007311117 /DNA_START=282 /DNA_END=986 /DNA_ORIENTATION=+
MGTIHGYHAAEVPTCPGFATFYCVPFTQLVLTQLVFMQLVFTPPLAALRATMGTIHGCRVAEVPACLGLAACSCVPFTQLVFTQLVFTQLVFTPPLATVRATMGTIHGCHVAEVPTCFGLATCNWVPFMQIVFMPPLAAIRTAEGAIHGCRAAEVPTCSTFALQRCRAVWWSSSMCSPREDEQSEQDKDQVARPRVAISGFVRNHTLPSGHLRHTVCSSLAEQLKEGCRLGCGFK